MSTFAVRPALILVLSLFVCFPGQAQELVLPVAPGVTVLRDRTVPSPAGVSPEMAEIVAERQIPGDIPLPDTTEGWVQFQTLFDVPGSELALQGVEYLGASYEVQEIAGVRCYVVTPAEILERFEDRVFVHIHGGAWVFGGGDSALREALWAAHGLGVKVISVDYRRPPLHPFPEPLDDVLAVWREVMKSQSASKTALFGTSAGGNMTLATTLRLKELGEPLPGALFAGTPATDLENVSDTWVTPAGSGSAGQARWVGAGGHGPLRRGRRSGESAPLTDPWRPGGLPADHPHFWNAGPAAE